MSDENYKAICPTCKKEIRLMKTKIGFDRRPMCDKCFKKQIIEKEERLNVEKIELARRIVTLETINHNQTFKISQQTLEIADLKQKYEVY